MKNTTILNAYIDSARQFLALSNAVREGDESKAKACDAQNRQACKLWDKCLAAGWTPDEIRQALRNQR